MKKKKYLAIFMAMSMATATAPVTALAEDVSVSGETEDTLGDEEENSDSAVEENSDESVGAVQSNSDENVNAVQNDGDESVDDATTETPKIDNITALTEAIQNAASGKTIQLDGNIGESVVVPDSANITLDLNGYSITASGTAILNNGILTVTDSQKSGKIVSKGNIGLCIGSGSNTTIQYAQITGQEGAFGVAKVNGVATSGATLEIEDGVFTGIDNAVVILNGSKREGKANEITINGGTFNGGIKTSGYVACGIYAPWKDEITVNDGTFNITGGAGIVARAGTVTVNGGEFNTTGDADAVGKVGDSRVVVPCAAIVFDSDAGYPGMTDASKITVSGGSFTSEADTIAFVKKDGDENKRIVVSGGVFSDAVAETYAEESYHAVKTTDSKYAVANSISLDKTSTRIRRGNTDTLKATVKANGETYDADVAWASDNETIATVADGVVTGEDYGTAKITATADELTATCDVEVFKKKSSSSSSSSSGGGSATTTDTNKTTVSDSENGAVTASTTKAKTGDKVVLTPKAEDGYVLDKITVKDKDGNEVTVKAEKDGTYSFTMPEGGVTVDTAFKQADENTDQPAAEDAKTIVLQVGSTLARADEKTVINDVAPVIRNSRTLVPVRFITEMLGGQVAWNETTKEVTLTIDGKEIKMTIGAVLEKYGVAPVIIDGRTFVPVRFVADELGATVAWDEATKEVTITKIEK